MGRQQCRKSEEVAAMKNERERERKKDFILGKIYLQEKRSNKNISRKETVHKTH